MLYTISDFSREYEGSVRLIAGSDGVSRAVSGVGILDYELMPGLKNKYQRANFSSDEIVLSTFLYAKDDPYLITEAVKYLVAKGTSGLIIKNVLHIPIPDQAIRYANARHYPVFLTTDDSLFFDSVIYEVKRHIEQLASIDFAQREIDALRTDVSPESICRRIRGLNPSFLDEAVALFASFAEPLDPRTFLQIERLCAKSTLAGCHNMLAPYDGGLLFVATSDSEQTLDVERSRSSSRLAASMAERKGSASAIFCLETRRWRRRSRRRFTHSAYLVNEPRVPSAIRSSAS